MQRIIQINIAGRVLPIEEDAYLLLKDYLSALQRQFTPEEGRDEIVHDIEYRIAELFSIRLQGGAPAIDNADVSKVMENLGTPSALGGQNTMATMPVPYTKSEQTNSSSNSSSNAPNSQGFDQTSGERRRIFRNPNDKLLGGVCSGLANYFDIDPVIVRLIWAAFGSIGVGVVAYFIAWIVIPVPTTPQDYSYMTGGKPANFHDITRNVADEMQDLKRRGEQMSRELKDFFSKKK